MERREIFDLVAAHAFAETFQMFPHSWKVRPSELASALNADLVTVEQSLRWLTFEGFLRSHLELYGDKEWTLFLTAKSFYVLDKLPTSLKADERLGPKFLSFLKGGAQSVAADLVATAITAGVTAGWSR